MRILLDLYCYYFIGQDKLMGVPYWPAYIFIYFLIAVFFKLEGLTLYGGQTFSSCWGLVAFEYR